MSMPLTKLNFKSSSSSPIQSDLYHAIRQLRAPEPRGVQYGPGDCLVLFGELFQKGYANGLVQAATQRGLKVIYATVGRREGKALRALNAEEVAAAPKPLINIPLEAGFDLELDQEGELGKAPVDQLSGLGLKDWEACKINWDSIEKSRQRGIQRFRSSTEKYLAELEAHIPTGANVLFAHLMAGGVPRTKIVMPIMNRVFKGTGDRHLSSEYFWGTEIGRFCALNFYEVTADTFNHLIELSSPLRERLQAKGQKVAYSAYGYHGTEVFFEGAYRWQSYTPYVQGFAKKRLEDHARRWTQKGVAATVYNCPEILTNSSSIFQGVELPLYPLLNGLRHEGGANHPRVKEIFASTQAVLKPEASLEKLLETCEAALVSKEIQEHCFFDRWPQHNNREQMDLMLKTSDAFFEMHRDPKNLLTSILSEVVFSSCGRVMIEDALTPKAPVSWLNHDVVARGFLA